MSDSISELWERNKARSRFEPEEIAAVHLYKMVITDMMQQNGVSNDIIEACFDAAAELFSLRFIPTSYSKGWRKRCESHSIIIRH